MRSRIAVLLAVLISFVIAILAISSLPSPSTDSERDTVIVSVEPFAYFVDKLAPDLFRTVVMLPAGVNHDTYEPTIEQLKAAARARVFVKVGHPSFIFETAWLDKIIAEHPKAVIVDASLGIDLKAGDPHIWLSPRACLTIVRSVARGLSSVKPEAQTVIAANLARLEVEIERVDQAVREIFAGHEGSTFLVYHSAWRYFADDFNLHELSIEREGKEPDAAETARIIEQAKKLQLKTLLIEPQFSRASAETVAREIGADVQVVDHMRRDWPNNLVETARVIREALGK